MQVGMLEALRDVDLHPDLVVGTSVGSLNGAVVAMDPRGAASRLTHLWATVPGEQIFPGRRVKQLWTLRTSRTHLFPNDGLRRFVSEIFGERAFEDLALPFGAVVTDVPSGLPVLVRAGPLTPALLASAAVPAIYPPVRVGERLCYDGGLVANVPVRQAVTMGARSLVVLDCSFAGAVPPPPDDLERVLAFLAVTVARNQVRLELPAIAEEMPVLHLPGPQLTVVNPLEFTGSAALVAQAYEAARPFLDTVRVDGPGLYGPVTEPA
jgi:NTE family protein